MGSRAARACGACWRLGVARRPEGGMRAGLVSSGAGRVWGVCGAGRGLSSGCAVGSRRLVVARCLCVLVCLLVAEVGE
jgi:hypothetical protein